MNTAIAQDRQRNVSIFRAVCLLMVLAGALVGSALTVAPRNVTFYHISDQHYGAKSFDPAVLRKTIDAMNELPGTRYPKTIGGFVEIPKGVILTGDLTDSGQPSEWSDFVADWGLTGLEGRLRFPLYEMAGNHDGGPSTRSGDRGYVRRQIIQRNKSRVNLANRSGNGLHYSWDWDDVHLVCLNEYAGLENDQRYPGNPTFNRKKEDYGNPAQDSLQFLAEDLAARVGMNNRPIILAQHYGFDDFAFHPWGEKASWWTEEHALRLWEVMEGYNVIAILSGHDGSEAAVPWHGILNQHMDDPVRFGVYHLSNDQMTLAKRNAAKGVWEETWKHPIGATRSLPPELVQGPYLVYPNDPGKMTVAWRCKSNIACRLMWGDDQFHYEDGTVTVMPYDSANHLYRYTISGLPADTGVNFSLEINGRHAPGMFYTPPAAGTQKIRFLACAPTHSSPGDTDLLYQSIYDKIYEDPACHTFLLHTGNFDFNEARLEDWDRMMFSRAPQSRHARYVQSRLPIMGPILTRESRGTLARKILPYPYRDAGYYSFDYGPVHIAVLDQSKSCSPVSPQYSWLKSDLASTERNWKMLLLGDPPAARSEAESLRIEPHIRQLCETHGVDICFAGRGVSWMDSDVSGTRYIATGGAPIPIKGVSRSGVSSAEVELQYCVITIDGDTLSFQACRPDGRTIDSFSMKNKLGTGTSNANGARFP